MKSKRFYIYLSITIVLSIFIIVNAFIPGGESEKESSLIADICRSIINAIKPDTINDSNYASFSLFMRKFIGHFSLFMVTGFFSLLTLKHFDKSNLMGKYVIAILYSLLLAILSELIQVIIPNRYGSVDDVIIDTRGFLLGTTIALLICLFINKRMNKKQIIDKI